MTKPAAEDRRLVRLTNHFSGADPRADPRADPLVCAGPPGPARRAKLAPGNFYLPAYLAPNGWVALRLDVGEVDWDEVSELVACSYRLVAPKRLAALVKVAP